MAVVLLGAAIVPPASAEARPSRVVVLGDSLAAGYGLGAADAFPSRLEAGLRAQGIDVVVFNAGVSGDTSAGGRARLGWVLTEPSDLVVVELGGNDGLRGIAPRDTEANLDAILAELGRRRIPALLTGMLAPPNMGEDFAGSFNAIFPRLAAKHKVAFYPFFLDGVAADRSLNQPDGIHPNAQGVRVIVDRIAPHVLRLLRATPARP